MAFRNKQPFSVLPFSEDPQGGVHFDIHAGLTGAALDAFTAPGDAYAGRLDPASPEDRSVPRLRNQFSRCRRRCGRALAPFLGG